MAESKASLGVDAQVSGIQKDDLKMANDRFQQQELMAVSPLDGRYLSNLRGLGHFFSESALIRYRLLVEARWLEALTENLPGQKKLTPALLALVREWSEEPAYRDGDLAGDPSTLKLAWQVKTLESVTNHDVKAVEYFMRDALLQQGADASTLAMLHFGATSEDINNLAYGLMTQSYVAKRLLPLLDQFFATLHQLIEKTQDTPMIGRTHGQPATPTTMGKEMAVFFHRLLRQRRRLVEHSIEGKMNGAVGNFNAHLAAYPDVAWESLAKKFVEDLGLTYNPMTTQIENHDSHVEFLEIVNHISTILIGFARDIWGYISVGYFKQKILRGEVGSSTMPHKVNPIDFENAEGNLGLALSMARHFCEKLPVSRWQRDLSDSTVMRSTGVILGHFELALKSMIKGMSKLEIDSASTQKDLNESWEILAEPLQTVLRKHGVADAYERLKEATRGQRLSREAYLNLVERSLEIPLSERESLKALTPWTYLGLAPQLARRFAAVLSTPAFRGGKR